MRMAFFVFACAVAALAQTAHQHHPPQSADEYAKVLDDPKRDAWDCRTRW